MGVDGQGTLVGTDLPCAPTGLAHQDSIIYAVYWWPGRLYRIDADGTNELRELQEGPYIDDGPLAEGVPAGLRLDHP
jgi:hypothetical protein